MAKQITGLDDALAYVRQCGFTISARHAFPGWIPEAQRRMCDAADALLHASGQNSWYEKEFKPFYVRFRPYRDVDCGTFPYLSEFEVWSEPKGPKTILHCRNLK